MASGSSVNPWSTMMADCLAEVEREQAGSLCPVVDHEVLPALAGGADDMSVWLICRNPEEKQRFADTERQRFVAALKRRMLARRFPESAVTTLRIRVTSRPEVEAAGGRLPYSG